MVVQHISVFAAFMAVIRAVKLSAMEFTPLVIDIDWLLPGYVRRDTMDRYRPSSQD